MTYVILFLPSIVSLAALCISLIYGRNKSALIIAAVAAMAVFLLVKDALALAKAVNSIVLTFALVYLVISLAGFVKRKKEEER